MTRVAVIVTTYNWPESLEKVLEGLMNQTQPADEIWVADDGSAKETEQVVERASYNYHATLSHVWQEDKGFRAAAIRNRALKHIKSEYVVFLDGDCVPLPDFVESHRLLAQPGYCVVGNRVLLSRQATANWLSHASPYWPKNFYEWLNARRQGAINRCAPLIHLPVQGRWSSWRTQVKQTWLGAKTCNLGFWKKDLLEINGLDESYSGWGLEDSDLMIRALRKGIHRKSGQFATGVIHLWHHENDRSGLEENQKRLKSIIDNDHVQAKIGINQIFKEDHQVSIFKDGNKMCDINKL